jgi:tripartite ATP-independent transporter DctP family solute receptor
VKVRGKFTLIWLTVLTVLFLASSLYAAEYTIRVANNVAADHAWGKGMEVFKDYLEDASNGRIAVEVYHAGALGTTREAIEMVGLGTLEVALCGTAYVQSYVPEMGITLLPYLWKDRDTMFGIIDGPLGEHLNQRLEEAGFHVLGYLDNGFRHITTRAKPVRSVKDLEGLKIRCLPTPVHIAFFKALGAAPTPIDWVELYDALRMRVVDAQENPPAMVHTARFFEVQKYYSLSGHVNEPGMFIMSKKFYDGLPAELKLAVDIAARKATVWERAECYKDNQKMLKSLEEAGMEISKVPPETVDEFRRVAHEEVYPEVVDKFGPIGKELVDLFIWANK